MIKKSLRWSLVSFLVVVWLGTTALAQAPDQATRAVDEQVASAPVTTDTAAASEVRNDLRELLRRYPPDLPRVLRLDPTLFGNQAYMASYPALRAFVAQHPEVARNTEYFLVGASIPEERGPEDRMVDAWMNTMGAVAGIVVFLVVTTVLAWLVRTFVEQKRWNRLSRVQQEVHNKVLDRFTTNEDLLAYMQTSAGRRFLEAAPIPVDSPRSVDAPINRILWSVQAGVVLAALGIGLQLVTGHVPQELDPVLFVMGMVALSIGAGFVLSAFVSFVLTRKLGLWTPPAARPEDDAGSAVV